MAKKRAGKMKLGSAIRNLRGATERANYLSKWAGERTPQLERMLDKAEAILDDAGAQLERMHKALHVAAGSKAEPLVPKKKAKKKAAR